MFSNCSCKQIIIHGPNYFSFLPLVGIVLRPCAYTLTYISKSLDLMTISLGDIFDNLIIGYVILRADFKRLFTPDFYISF